MTDTTNADTANSESDADADVAQYRTSTADDFDPVENRSEIVFLYDAVDTNPNGNPLSANNKPRIDSTTGEAVVTDVRLKRYLRDQLDDDGYGIYLRAASKASYTHAPGRNELFQRVTGLSKDEINDLDGTVAATEFTRNATDVRYFGATGSFSEEFRNALGERFPGQFIGPVQFSHGRSLHEVVEKTESQKLTTVVGSSETGFYDDSDDGDSDDEQDRKQTGTFASDNRLEYALVGFHGVVNENAADDTNLSALDVRRLDSLCWRALKNQTLTRSKMGHTPRLYVRAEYATDDYHLGSLDDGVAMHGESLPDEQLRSITDVVLDATDLVDQLAYAADQGHIETVHVAVDQYLDIAVGDEHGDPTVLLDAIEDAVGPDALRVIDDPYDEHAVVTDAAADTDPDAA